MKRKCSNESFNQAEKITLSTANGTITAHKINIKEFTVGAITKQDFLIAVLPQAKLPSNIDGLLGTDWLQAFYFVIDKKQLLLRLTPH
ncbi:retroviral-like aspartic protease family protein [Isorropodon fossajaponicum symbiont]|uniref:retroviral-like aspartic protease family protein n=1 Tax=Isorropodon fossajaponicum symbiont TaxID=883811 RepID=UPI001916658F|nr:retroviral-like aspartic protease family protein [Isorropodon fossajaponicum symbiont]